MYSGNPRITNYFIEDAHPTSEKNHKIHEEEHSNQITPSKHQHNFASLLDLCLLSIELNNSNVFDLYMILQTFQSGGNVKIQSKYNECVIWIITRLSELDASLLPQTNEMNYFRTMHEFYKQSRALRGDSGGFVGIDFSITDSKELFGILKESILERQERYLESFDRNEKEIESIISDLERLRSTIFIINWDRRQQTKILEARLLIRQKEKDKLENQRISNERLEDFYTKHATALNVFHLSRC